MGEISTTTRLAAFAAALTVVFGGAWAIGGLRTSEHDHSTHSHGDEAGGGSEGSHDESTAGEGAHAGHGANDTTSDTVLGLSDQAHGLELAVETDTSTWSSEATGTRTLELQVRDDEGRPITDFELEGGVPMHLIVVRADLSSYEHVHPTADADGTWSAPVHFPSGGAYRAYVDLLHEGEKVVLGTELSVPGPLRTTPPPEATTRVTTEDGYVVELDADDDGSQLAFTITRDGRPVSDLQEFVGARAHLVAIRESDLGYLHVHPLGEHAAAGGDHGGHGGHQAPPPVSHGGKVHGPKPASTKPASATRDGAKAGHAAGHGAADHGGHGSGATAAANGDGTVRFAAEFPGGGAYRLFLQFRHDGAVQTAAFPYEVD